VQAAGIIFFISSLSSTVENNYSKIGRLESSIIEIAASVEALDKSITLMHDQQKNINAAHELLFQSGSYNNQYVPAERRQYD
tara:strand:+ start:352 stop:597 length:246 start_codon:yes stop_codon:yes gene_type:complete